MNSQSFIHHRAALIHEQMERAWSLVQHEISRDDFLGPSNPYFKLLDRLYTEDYPLSRLLDSSDLVFHAEGPAAKDAMPTLHAVNWLIGSAEKQVRALARALFDLTMPIMARKIAQGIDLRMTGFAPGSIYAGLRLEPDFPDLLGDPELEPVFMAVRESIRRLPIIPGFVGNEALDTGIYEAIPDPAQRDAGLTAAFHLSPTGRYGIHTVEIFSPGEKPAELSQRERVVIRDALNRPKMRTSQHGKFVGVVREVDLDKSRFHIRVSGIGSLRCILPDFTASRARPLLDSLVEVTGEYEVDAEDRPRLMFVTHIEPIEQGVQLEI